MVQNAGGDIAAMLEGLTEEIAEAAEVLARSRITFEGAVYLCNVVLMPRALYRLKLSHASVEQVDAVQGPLRRMLAGKVGMRAAHTKVLHGGFMGCGWRRWSDEVGIERLLAVVQAWEEHTTVYARVVRGAVWQMQRESDGGVGVALAGRYSGGGNDRVDRTWLGQLWRWMSGHQVGLRLQGVQREGRAADMSSTKPLVELVAGKRERRLVESGCRRLGVVRKAELLQQDGIHLRRELQRGGEWERAEPE